MSVTTEEVGSMPWQLSGLAFGESFAKCRRIPLDHASRDAIVEHTAALRNTMAAAMRRAEARTGYDFALETGSFLTLKRDIMLVCAVTRIR